MEDLLTKGYSSYPLGQPNHIDHTTEQGLAAYDKSRSEFSLNTGTASGPDLESGKCPKCSPLSQK